MSPSRVLNTVDHTDKSAFHLLWNIFSEIYYEHLPRVRACDLLNSRWASGTSMPSPRSSAFSQIRFPNTSYFVHPCIVIKHFKFFSKREYHEEKFDDMGTNLTVVITLISITLKTLINYSKEDFLRCLVFLVYRSGKLSRLLTNVASKYGRLQISFSFHHSIWSD